MSSFLITFSRSSPTADNEYRDARRLRSLRQLGEGVGRALGVPAVGEQDDALDAIVQLLVDDGQGAVADVGAARQTFH